MPNYAILRRWVSLMDPKTMLTDAWYSLLYSPPNAKGKALGDITPSYCSLPPEGIDDLKRRCDTPKIISSSVIPLTELLLS